MGSFDDAVNSYSEKELPVSAKKEILQKHRLLEGWDDVVMIRKNSITSDHDAAEYESAIYGMHWGDKGFRCKGKVNRSSWKEEEFQKAIAYCSGVYCVIYPEICRNVALIVRKLPEIDLPPTGAILPPLEMVGPPLDLSPIPEVPPEALIPPFQITNPPEENVPPEVVWGPPSVWYPPITFYTGPCCGPISPPVVPPVTHPVPEPSAWVLLFIGLGVMVRKFARR